MTRKQIVRLMVVQFSMTIGVAVTFIYLRGVSWSAAYRLLMVLVPIWIAITGCAIVLPQLSMWIGTMRRKESR